MRERVRDYALLLAVSAALTLPNLGGHEPLGRGRGRQRRGRPRDARGRHLGHPHVQLRAPHRQAGDALLAAAGQLRGVRRQRVVGAAAVGAGRLARPCCSSTNWPAGCSAGRTGLLAGIVLASAVEFCLLAHAATPDATLLLFTVLTFYLFWVGHENGSRRWWVPTAAACGLAVLTKGPVGVALPGLVILLYFAWNRELGRLLDRRLVGALLASSCWWPGRGTGW